MTVTGVVSVVLLVAGLVIVVGSCAGMAVLDDPLDRLHLTTPAAMLGSTGICASVVVRDGLSASGLAAIGVAVILIGANPLAGHAVARAIAVRRGATWSEPADPSGGSGGGGAVSEAVIAVALVWVAASGTAVVLTQGPATAGPFVAGFFGLGLAFLYLSLQAGDVALSQIVVGAIALPLIVLLSLAKVGKEPGMSRRARLAFFAAAAAALAVTLGVGLAGLPSFGSQITSYARMLNELAPRQRHVTDVVSAITFDYRGIDTPVLRSSSCSARWSGSRCCCGRSATRSASSPRTRRRTGRSRPRARRYGCWRCSLARCSS